MMRRAYVWAVITVAGLVVVAGCAGNGSGSSTTHPIGDPAIKAAVVAAQADLPLDAVPSPDGTVIYYIATGDRGPTVLRVPSVGGAASIVVDGAPLAKPTGIALAVDGARLYLADQQAEATGAAGAGGAILTVGTIGSLEALSLLPGTRGRSPRGLDVGADVIFFTGTDPVNGLPGLFEVPVAGGTVLTMAEGAPFVAPDSVVVTAQGVAYVSDHGQGTGQGKVFRVSGGTVTPILAGLHLGAPAGVTLANNDATLLVSSMDATTLADQVLFFDLATGRMAAATKVIGTNKNTSGGLHRAHNASVLAWADVSRSGTVFRVEL